MILKPIFDNSGFIPRSKIESYNVHIHFLNVQVGETETKHRRGARQKLGMKNFGLFPDERETARRLSQSISEWRAKAVLLERYGLPTIDALMGGRFWPAVEAFWRRRYGLSSTIEMSNPDGEENLDEL